MRFLIDVNKINARSNSLYRQQKCKRSVHIETTEQRLKVSDNFDNKNSTILDRAAAINCAEFNLNKMAKFEVVSFIK